MKVNKMDKLEEKIQSIRDKLKAHMKTMHEYRKVLLKACQSIIDEVISLLGEGISKMDVAIDFLKQCQEMIGCVIQMDDISHTRMDLPSHL